MLGPLSADPFLYTGDYESLPRVVFRHMGLRVVAVRGSNLDELEEDEPMARWVGEVLDRDRAGGTRWSDAEGELVFAGLIEIIASWMVAHANAEEDDPISGAHPLQGPWMPRLVDWDNPSTEVPRVKVAITGDQHSLVFRLSHKDLSRTQAPAGEGDWTDPLDISGVSVHRRSVMPDVHGDCPFHEVRRHQHRWSDAISVATTILCHPSAFTFRLYRLSARAPAAPPRPRHLAAPTPKLWSPPAGPITLRVWDNVGAPVPRAKVDSVWSTDEIYCAMSGFPKPEPFAAPRPRMGGIS